MWSPTHVQITVCRARNLKVKGKSGTNDAYVIIKLGKERFQTSVCERSKTPEWLEQCEFALADSSATVKLKALHRNLVGRDDFLGQVDINLKMLKVHERPRTRWYSLLNKPGTKTPDQYRGELEVVVSFHVRSLSTSQLCLNKTPETNKMAASFRGLAHQVGEKLTNKVGSRLSFRSNSRQDVSRTDSATRTNVILPTSYNVSRQEADDDDNTGSSQTPVTDRQLNSDDDDDDDDDNISERRLSSTGRDVIGSQSTVGHTTKTTGSHQRLMRTGFLSRSSYDISSWRTSTEPSPRVSTFGPLGEEQQQQDTAAVSSASDAKNPFYNTTSAVGDEPVTADVTGNNTDVDKTTFEEDERTKFKVREQADDRNSQSRASLTTNQNTTTTPIGCDDVTSAQNKSSSSSESSLDASGSENGGKRNIEQFARNGENKIDYFTSESSSATPPAATCGEQDNVFPHSTEPSRGSEYTGLQVSSSRLSSLGEKTDNNEMSSFSAASAVQAQRQSSTPDLCVVSVDSGLTSCSAEVEPSYTDSVRTMDKSENSWSEDETDKTLTDNRHADETDAEAVPSRPVVCHQETQTNSSPASSSRQIHHLSPAVINEFNNYSRQDLLYVIVQHRQQLRERDSHVADLEQYIDNLLAKVLDLDLQPLLLSSSCDSASPAALPFTGRQTGTFAPPPKPARASLSTGSLTRPHFRKFSLKSLQGRLK